MLRPEEQLLADIQEFSKEAMLNEPLQKEAQAWMKMKSLWRNMFGGAAGGAKSLKKLNAGKGWFDPIKNMLSPGRASRLTSGAAREAGFMAQQAGLKPGTHEWNRFIQKKVGGNDKFILDNVLTKAEKLYSSPKAQTKFLREQAFDLRKAKPDALMAEHASALKPKDFKAFKRTTAPQAFNTEATGRLGKKWDPNLGRGIQTPGAPPVAAVADDVAAVADDAVAATPPGVKQKADGSWYPEKASKQVKNFQKAYDRSAGTWNDPGLQKAWNRMAPADRQMFMANIRKDATMGRAFEKLQTFGWGSLNPVERAKLVQAGAAGFVGQRLVLKDEAII